MKKIISILLLVTSVFSCSEDSLTLNSPNDVTVADLITSTTGFEQLLLGAYDGYQKIPVNEYLITELRTDNSRANTEVGIFPAFNDYTITDDNLQVFNYWSNNYKVIFQSNIIIDNQDAFLSMSGDMGILGEAYFLRALSHFNLVRAYRDIPYVDRVVTLDDYQSIPQGEESDTYAKINADFEKAIEFLAGTDNSNTRASEGAAIIFLAKSLLSQPSPDYARAQTLLLPLTSENNAFGYVLTENYDDIFGRGDGGDEDNEEIIFKIPYTQSSGIPVTSDSETEDQVQSEAERFSIDMTQDGLSNGVNLATEDLKTVMTSTLEPVRYFTTLDDNTFADDDTFNNKWVPDNGENSGNDWIVLRYADVLLLYCEAVIGDTQSTDNVETIEIFNRIRERAQLDPVDTSISLQRDVLLNERRMEFVFENQRLYDLIRFGRAVEILQSYSDTNGFSFSPTDIYLSIPQREIDNTDGFIN